MGSSPVAPGNGLYSETVVIAKTANKVTATDQFNYTREFRQRSKSLEIEVAKIYCSIRIDAKHWSYGFA